MTRVLGCYLGGVNTRRIRTALKPLLGERHLSKSAGLDGSVIWQLAYVAPQIRCASA